VAERGDINEIVDLVKTYAKQETIDPLRSTGRYLARGLAGGFLVGLGLVLLLISLLRVLQTETDVFEDSWSFVPYFIVVIVGGLIAAFFVSRISKGGLDG
jgi:flagellar biosynthesis protein FliQ